MKTVILSLLLLASTAALATPPDWCAACAGQCGAPCGNGGVTCPLDWICGPVSGNCEPVCQDNPITCTHDPRDLGGPLVAGCGPGVADACAVDPWCCSGGWDRRCVAEAGFGVHESPACFNQVPQCYGTCPHDYCGTGAGMPPGCIPGSSCVDLIDMVYPSCASTWDASCVAAVGRLCASGEQCW